MASVDDRIVSMQFDNNAFQTKVADTIASLDRLKTSLDFSNAKNNFGDIEKASNSVHFAGMAGALDSINSKLSTLGSTAFTVITNITNRVVDLGIQIGKSLSLDQVIGGFQEYQTNINSIQTILANTKSDGTNLEQVNGALDELNTFADQTIYNFSQMTKNIGTFTAAGIDLDTSVGAIKGIANLAAISGSNADQASSAMYQLSQALASGSVKLMDWNSIVNAGMGGEVFQKSLFESGKALKTLIDVPIEQTFDEWKAAGNTFRGSLEDGWITADVLTNTLQGFTGDLTAEQIKALGYTEEQTQGILEMGKTGKDAATKVKTLSQLIDTTKEAIGSGWSESFRIIIGNFDEAKEVFTGFSNSISTVVSASAESRNKLLQGWKDLGGRALLIESITGAFKALGSILSPINQAFRELFPKITSERLFELTKGLHDLVERLTLTPAATVTVLRVFRGIFSAFRIGIEVVQGVGRMFKELFEHFKGDSGSKITNFLTTFADKISALKEKLVDARGIDIFFHQLAQTIINFADVAKPKIEAFKNTVIEIYGEIRDFFSGLTFDNVLERLVGLFGKVKTSISGLFDGVDTDQPTILSGLMDRLGERFSWVTKIGGFLSTAFSGIAATASTIAEPIGKFLTMVKDSFSNLPGTIATALADTDYDQALDTVNTGLFAGLVAMIANFFRNGFSGGGVLKNINKSLEGLTGVLQAMQTSIKADALLKIAGAVAVLTASMLVLSLINSAALTKALTAMAVGFGELVGVMTALNQIISGPKDAAKLTVLAGGLILLAGALLILSVAVKILSTLSLEELGKGLGAITVLLGVLSLAIKPLSENSSGMIKAGLGLIAVSVALNILAGAVALFAAMSWDTMVQGLAGVAGGLLILAGGLQLMPDGLVTKGAGLILTAVALNILAGAVALFGTMEWETLAKGMAAIAASLLILAGAMEIMPNGILLTLQGAGLALIGVGLVSISQAIQSLGSMSWKSMIKGIGGIAGVLGVLAIAMIAMEGAIGGAVAITIASVGLIGLAKAVKAMAALKISEIITGILGLAAVLAALALGALAMQPAIPALLGLGAALLLVGAGFALFGIGATAIATAFGIIATAGTEGVATLASALDVLIEHLPAAIVALGEGFINLAGMILEALPGLITNLSSVIGALLQLFIDNIPKLGETFKVFILTALDVVKDVSPDIVATGFQLLLDFLQGIDDNIEEITSRVVSIITKFLTEVGKKENIDKLVGAGLDLLTNFLLGISDHIGDVISAGVTIVVKLIEAIGYGIIDMVTAGANMIVKFIEGVTNSIDLIITAGVEAFLKFLEGLSKNALLIIDTGFNLIIDFINGVAESIRVHAPQLRAAGANLASAILEGFTGGMDAGSIVDTFVDTFAPGLSKVKRLFGISSPSKVFRQVGKDVVEGFVIGLRDDKAAVQGAEDLSNNIIDTLREAFNEIVDRIVDMDDFHPVITPVLDLSRVENEATRISRLLETSPLATPRYSIDQARIISDKANISQEDASRITVGEKSRINDITFNQYNNSPESISTSDVYRNTRNQIAMAKEELARV